MLNIGQKSVKNGFEFPCARDKGFTRRRVRSYPSRLQRTLLLTLNDSPLSLPSSLSLVHKGLTPFLDFRQGETKDTPRTTNGNTCTPVQRTPFPIHTKIVVSGKDPEESPTLRASSSVSFSARYRPVSPDRDRNLPPGR